MKPLLVTLAASAVGLAIGYGLTWNEFRNEPEPWAAYRGVGGGAALATTQQPDQPLPRVEVSSVQHDFGRFDQGMTQEHTFTIRNVGQGPLNIRRGGTSCRCTIANLGTETDSVDVAPGDEIPVKLSIDDSLNPGTFAKAAVLWTNDPQLEKLTLTLIGEVMASIFTEPSQVIFSSLQSKQTAEAKVKIATFREGAMEILSHSFEGDTSRDFFEAEYRPLTEEELKVIKGKSGFEVTIRVLPGLPLGTMEERLVLETNLPSPKRVYITVAGRVEGEINVTGRDWDKNKGLLKLENIAGGTLVERKLMLMVTGEHRETTTFTIEKTEPQWIEATLDKGQVTSSTAITNLTIRIPASAPPTARRGGDSGYGHVWIKTTHPDAPELRVDLDFSVQSSQK